MNHAHTCITMFTGQDMVAGKAAATGTTVMNAAPGYMQTENGLTMTKTETAIMAEVNNVTTTTETITMGGTIASKMIIVVATETITTGETMITGTEEAV